MNVYPTPQLRQRRKRKGTFSPEDEQNVKHTKIGIWDLYEEKQLGLKTRWTSRFNKDDTVEQLLEVKNSLPYILRMIKDVGSIRALWLYFAVYLSLELVGSLIPALNLWYSSQLLTIVETAVEERTVDKNVLLRVAMGRVFCSIVTILFSWGKTRVTRPLNNRIRQHYSGYMFQTMARLDLPAFEDSGIQRQLTQVFMPGSQNSAVWHVVLLAVRLCTTALQVVSQLSVLVTVLRNQRDGPLLAVVSFSQTLLSWGTRSSVMPLVWAATTKDEDYIKMEGLRRTIKTMVHRKEIVAGDMWRHMHSTDSLINIRRLYEIIELPNRIPDGTVPFPEDQQALRSGISVEFRDVSFRYPESEAYALHRLSFKIEKGQLCVIIGKNGSGKSTILKLISRLYDPEEGQILIDGRDIKTLKLEDLRRAMAVLFQDYTHFPLSIKDNIGYGDPEHADDQGRIEQAAQFGGADEFIRKLPDEYDTYLVRPVQDFYSNLPEGTKSLFGRDVNFSGLRRMGGMKAANSSGLSGGQMQRIALYVWLSPREGAGSDVSL
ncbi:hypothetical protein V5O48_017080 [Marasmius crinis-equi]|uniref:ABC transporter domain-containing protein n=1 Tax=Marasmius crinis-equi TaxID=585013 RepID=A0ABR3EQ61_9AGAR